MISSSSKCKVMKKLVNAGYTDAKKIGDLSYRELKKIGLNNSEMDVYADIAEAIVDKQTDILKYLFSDDSAEKTEN